MFTDSSRCLASCRWLPVCQMVVNLFVVYCFILQEGAFALAFKSTKFPGEIVATRFVAVYSSIITGLSRSSQILLVLGKS